MKKALVNAVVVANAVVDVAAAAAVIAKLQCSCNINISDQSWCCCRVLAVIFVAIL